MIVFFEGRGSRKGGCQKMMAAAKVIMMIVDIGIVPFELIISSFCI